MAGCHRGECNTISLINEHSNKMDPKSVPLYSLIRASLNLHQTSSSLQYMVPNTVTMNLCIWWWIQRHRDSIHHLRLQQETSLMKHSVECSPLNETSVSHSFLASIMDYGETWGEIIIRARSNGHLQQNCIFWTWQGCWIRELTVAVASCTISGQDQTGPNASMDRERVVKPNP